MILSKFCHSIAVLLLFIPEISSAGGIRTGGQIYRADVEYVFPDGKFTLTNEEKVFQLRSVLITDTFAPDMLRGLSLTCIDTPTFFDIENADPTLVRCMLESEVVVGGTTKLLIGPLVSDTLIDLGMAVRCSYSSDHKYLKNLSSNPECK